MNRIWRSIVGKLWITILLLVSFVLFVFTILMLEFLENYHKEKAEQSLNQTASTIASIVDKYNLEHLADEIIEEMLPEDTNALLVSPDHLVVSAFQTGINKVEIQESIVNSKDFNKIYESNKPIIKEMILPSQIEDDKMESYFVLSYPLKSEDALHGAIFIYQNPTALHKTSQKTTKIVFLSAFIAFVLTTFFAFFLSSRITWPLRKMREHAFELAKGKFDATLPTTQNDEIGQLAMAFNQMGRQLKHHLEVINQEKEQLASVLTSMTDSVITFNRDRTILLSNPPADRLLQKWFLRKKSQGDSPIPIEIYEMLEHVLDFEDKLEEDIEMDGSYYRITISPLKNSQQSIRGAIAVIRDMTEQLRLEKLRSDFIANVSHELRTPIAMLQGYSEALLDDVVTEEEERNEMIRIIYDESQRMGRLVKDLLDLARMESGHTTLYKEDVSAVHVLERITQKFAQVAKEKHVNLKFKSSLSEDVMISLDEDRIEQVLTNLIDNAIRHTPENGSVTVSLDQEFSYAKIQVADTGEGIPQEDLSFVFERFYKADKARTRSKGGTGLGLAIAKNIVEAHKGNIKVDSTVGVGTTFTFHLPL
ncbi:ATP-binding protein [Lysinibacillus endophyticus]|uniref:histidine kinase n=1 Tax=Ureibacillus endophyticus TaxID=1978490 RepID=A0A494YV85_9BACL|nr:ATP-binding protein [Lysinibacillus endophyticus]MCP1144241.1 cell wall metabolism sensor histidine kinase WalK [Lysinibacillus endophyticus]RKQ14072.1 HAMP domain-containing protein [Lysinibacillus endophyticus]